MKILACVLFLICGPSSAQTYPSTGAAWALPGSWEVPTDPETAAAWPSIQSVKDWEVQHADVAFGADYGLAGNANIAAMGYMYNQVLNFHPAEREMALRLRAIAEGVNYENFFLHFAQDTVLDIDNASHSSTTPFNQRPSVVGWTANPGHAGYWLYQTPPWNVDAWSKAAEGGAVHVLLFEPFDELEIDLAAPAGGGSLVIEYPSALDAQGRVTQWSSMPINDGTANLTQSGKVRWTPPADWAMAALHDGSGASFGGGPFFTQTWLRDGGRMYAVRLKWLNGGSATRPQLADVRLRRWQPNLSPTQRQIPGWDAANDANGNGYVDDAEYATRTNTNASARFRYESRAVPLGRMWNASSSWCVSNLFNPQVREWLAQDLQVRWQAQGLHGAYNDDIFKTIGPQQFLLQSGGLLAETPFDVDSPNAESAYTVAFVSLLKAIGQVSGNPWSAGNISGANLYLDPLRNSMIDGMGIFLREAYLHAGQGLTGSFGINKAWDTFALSAAGKRSLIQMTTRYGNVRQIANTKENWQKDQEALLAQYYLINVPDRTYVHFWNHSYNYGSMNTDAASYYKAGVPKNIAYQPTEMLSIDIGVPANRIPKGYEPIEYMVSTLSDGGYTVIGNSTDKVLRHPELMPNGEVVVEPSYIFYLQKSANHPSVALPQETILARLYSKGLVLYRTDFVGHSTAFRGTRSGPVRLPGSKPYHRMDRTDPQSGIPHFVTEIDLAGYEGAVLVDVPKGLLKKGGLGQ